MTTRANSQFPRPDFHRQDKQPYGLRATVRERSLRSRHHPASPPPPRRIRLRRHLSRGHYRRLGNSACSVFANRSHRLPRPYRNIRGQHHAVPRGHSLQHLRMRNVGDAKLHRPPLDNIPH